jgi:hypothetical protein
MSRRAPATEFAIARCDRTSPRKRGRTGPNVLA